MDVLVVSLLGILVFGGVFLLLAPEWWSSSLGTLKDKSKKSDKGDANPPKDDK
ncbi:hypothetical protein JRI60_25240 [Archangium violaceum]|uniref:hypothetical protein n=1 Tax=Archangium violaceum TaxID=83451 RepID=UPI00194EAD91|nr:hypothetical protein [Archangium violaceum]QRO03092.1 hypothetical protein JRI60_25240 [Archangium violaceum]